MIRHNRLQKKDATDCATESDNDSNDDDNDEAISAVAQKKEEREA